MPPPSAERLDSLFDLVLSGGPLMVPIALCSIVALAYMVERAVRLRAGRLAHPRFGPQLAERLAADGAPGALELCRRAATAQGRVLAAGLERADAEWLEREKAVEDAGAREVQRLSANLRPLVVISMIAPLLGLLGTVWGMIDAFSSIAFEEGLGRPEALAAGISQALVTTAAGLAVAIPVQAAYYFYRSRIDRFVRMTEDTYAELAGRLRGAAPAVPVVATAAATVGSGAPTSAQAPAS